MQANRLAFGRNGQDATDLMPETPVSGDMPDTPRRGDLKVVLVHPEIPGNTGSVGRTCVALDLELIVIHPIGFDMSERAVRRAGLDYWKHVRLSEFDSWADFMADRTPTEEQLFLFENGGAAGSFYDAEYPNDAYLVFGKETKGLPAEVLDGRDGRTFHLPMRSEHIRSLNLANAATAAIYQAMRAYLS
jgi:tRNA (cytidine/uridine-2'-O-)-methyltransferase